MADEPESIGEVARLIKALEQHIDRRFNVIEQRLDRKVSTDVYNANQSHIERQIGELRGLIAEERQARVEAVAEEAKDREAAAKDNQDRIKAAGNTARWSVVVAVMILGVFLTILFRTPGTG